MIGGDEGPAADSPTEATGVEIEERRGKGGHYYARYRGRQTAISIHGDTDLGPAFIRRICKQLGLDPSKVL